eukprot:1157801-Pelagomonas_calceolata.AAC.6
MPEHKVCSLGSAACPARRWAVYSAPFSICAVAMMPFAICAVAMMPFAICAVAMMPFASLYLLPSCSERHVLPALLVCTSTFCALQWKLLLQRMHCTAYMLCWH